MARCSKRNVVVYIRAPKREKCSTARSYVHGRMGARKRREKAAAQVTRIEGVGIEATVACMPGTVSLYFHLEGEKKG